MSRFTDSPIASRCHLRLLGSIVLGVLLVACILNYIWTSTPDPVVLAHAGEVSSVTSAATHTLSLPFVVSQYCGPHPPAPSPFSIQIAALHQMARTAEGDQSLVMLTEDEWLALYDTAFVTLTTALAESGAGWSRVAINWAWIQPGEPPAEYVWGPYHDEKLLLVAEAGVRLIGTVMMAPDWAAETLCDPIYPDRLDEFAGFLTDLVNRYKQPPYNIKHWELFNEPDFSWTGGAGIGMACWGYDGDKYAQMLAAAYPAIKAADPEATVLMGGVAYDWFIEYGGPFNRYFPDEVMANGGGDYIDTLTFHYFPGYHAEWERWVPHGNPPTCGLVEDGLGTPYEAWGIDVIAKTNHFRNRMSTCFGVDKPVWVTELGEHGYSNDPDSLAQQARYVIKGNVRALSAGVENISWYAMDTYNDNYETALLFEDWTPKPAFYAYQTMTAELTGYEYARALDVPSAEAYVFTDVCGQEKTVAWGSGTLTVASAGRLRVVDRDGNETVVVDGGAGDVDGVQNGVVMLQLADEPVFVTIEQ